MATLMREFTDGDGVEWQVWEVNPTLHERSVLSGMPQRFLKVPSSWLCFQSRAERRRLTPVPVDWERADDAALARLCQQAEPAPKHAR